MITHSNGKIINRLKVRLDSYFKTDTINEFGLLVTKTISTILTLTHMSKLLICFCIFAVLDWQVVIMTFNRHRSDVSSALIRPFSRSEVPRRLFCFGSLVILDVARCYLWLFTLYINIKISRNSC